MGTELTNMVMIYDRENDAVIVQNRLLNWRGITFPGGHVENGESFYDSAVREVYEETGLCVRNLKSCGIIHWSDELTYERYVVFLYKTEDFSGELIDKTEEGEVFWVKRDNLLSMELSPNFRNYLTMFFDNMYSEAFCPHRGWENLPVQYKPGV